MAIKVHLYTERKQWGGTLHTTLCGRVRNLDDYNNTEKVEEVTCHFCKQIIEARAARKRAA